MYIQPVFFDIDGTLIDTHGAGRDAFARTLKRVFGTDDDLRYVHFAGATDLDIFRGVMENRGIKASRKQEKEFFRVFPEVLKVSIRERPVTLCPGVRELLAELSDNENVLVGLLTGNTEECAQIKLQACRLHGHFMLGAFGREHARRTDLARLALKRARAKLANGQVLARAAVIGDTPSDVAAARAVDALAIAVATGVYNEQSLRAAGADHVLKDLSDTKGVLGLLETSRVDSEP